MYEDFFADWILLCKLSESRRWIVFYIKEYFHMAVMHAVLYIMHAAFKLLTYNQNVSDDNFNTMYTFFFLQKISIVVDVM